jgi:hypothetical protein
MKTTDPLDYKDLFKIFSLGLTQGLIDKQEIIKWCDTIIIKDEEPDPFFIDISLSGTKSINDIISLIDEKFKDNPSKISARVVLGLYYKLYRQGKITLDKITHSIYWLHWESKLTESEKQFMYIIDDRYELAIAKTWDTVDNIEKEILTFLELYKDFTIENYENWKSKESEIDSKIETEIKNLLNQMNERQESLRKIHQVKHWDNKQS